MEAIPCVHCGRFFTPRNRTQNFCPETDCQRARKAAWQRYKMKTDPDYRTQQRLSQQKWLRDNPDYWRGYRKRNPDKTERNRTLQYLRNRRSRHPCSSSAPGVIAKMDARKSNHFDLVGRFYLIPLIAKMDASSVALYSISETCR